MGQFIESIRAVKQNYGKYDEWEQNQADERAKKEYLSKTLSIPKDKVDLTSKKSQTVIRATEIMDRYSEDNCEDVEQATNTVAGIVLPLLMLPCEFLTLKNPMRATIINSVIGLFAASSFILWGNSKQKEASRIGRFQARQNDLKDIKNFVTYTPEQIKEAEEKAKTITVDKEENGIFQTLKNLNKIRKDKKAYSEWAKTKDANAIEKLKNRKLTPQQIKAGNEDKELIVDTVKEINIKAEEYSENVENAFDTLETVSFLFSIPAGLLINKALKLAKTSPVMRKAAAFTVPILTPIVIGMQGTMAQKEASRVGRYQARKDLSENPARLMAYSDEEMKQAQHITAPKQKQSVTQKISQSFSFLKQYYKDNKEYQEYKKTAHQNREKLQKALADVKITDKQREEAENLQKKVFMAFEEIDEISQRYSEDVEAGSEIAKNVINQVWGLASAGAIALSGIAFAKGKFPVTKIANTLTNIGLKKNSTLRIAINDFYKTLKDNKLTQKFQLALLEGMSGINKFIQNNKVAEPQFNNLTKELYSLFNPVSLLQEGGFKNNIEPHLKQGKIAKWFRNLITEGADLISRSKIQDMQGGEAINSLLPKRKISDYKTLIGTGAVAGLPVLGTILAVPYMVNAWFTDIQKKAGKIGIMKAMEKIDNPRVFADNDIKVSEAINAKPLQDSNIFDDFFKI